MSRSQQLRAQHRKILLWSLGAAGVLHVLAFVFWPNMDGGAGIGFGMGAGPGIGGETNWIFVDVSFGPPAIFEVDGTISTEPPDRVLDADRAVRLSTTCTADSHIGRIPAKGTARLTVDVAGYASLLEVVESTGYACGDEVISAVAEDLRYLWLPSERFPAPVELIQPVTVARAWEVTGG